MKKGINLPHLFKDIDIKKRLLFIKEAGFDICMVSLDSNHEVIPYPIEEVVKYAKFINLTLDVAHAPYKEPDITQFWYDNEKGNEIEKNYYNSIDIANKNDIKIIVCHLHYGTNYKLSEIGLNRLLRLANYAKEKNVTIAVENLYSYDELTYIFSHIEHPNLKICFDSGHENFLTPNAEFLNKFNNKIVALHLHDNNGKTDEHKTIFSGNIDWAYIAKGVSFIKDIALTLEIKYSPSETILFMQENELKEILKNQYKSLLKLEMLIQQEKQKNNAIK